MITQDQGLAAMCLGRGAITLNQNGLVMDHHNIDGMLSSRHINRKLRNQGIYTSKPKKRDKSKDQEFEKTLRNILEEE